MALGHSSSDLPSARRLHSHTARLWLPARCGHELMAIINRLFATVETIQVSAAQTDP
jgi:hypothetical protein